MILISLLDAIFIYESKMQGSLKSRIMIVTGFFVALSASGFIGIVSPNFETSKFCEMNMNEEICSEMPRYQYGGAFRPTDQPLAISSPCLFNLTDGLIPRFTM